MSFTGKSRSKSRSENWGAGLLLVFFPEDSNNQSAINVDKTKFFSNSSPSSSPSSSTSSSSIKRTPSNLLLTKTQSTISICALLVFLSLLLFTLSTFEPTSIKAPPRRLLLPSRNPPSKWWKQTPNYSSASKITALPSALQGMGTLYRRGTKAMNDLVVCHLLEDVSEPELRLFTRVLFMSALSAQFDIVFLFSSLSVSLKFGSVIMEENDSFLKLVRNYHELNNSTSRFRRSTNELGFDMTRFLKVKKEKGSVEEPLWGNSKRAKINSNDSVEDESTRLTYGSVLGFGVVELDPENSLSGFLNHVPMSLRRWACYPMLLGRVKRNFRHVMLVDVKNLVVLGDPLGRVRNHSPESVHVFRKQEAPSSGKHGKKNANKTQSQFQVNSGIIMGGARGVRRLSSTMLLEIVRALMAHKRKSSVSESGVLTQLAANDFVLKNVRLIKSNELVPEVSSLSRSNSNSAGSLSIVQRGNSNHEEVNSVIMKKICSFEVDSLVYSDCFEKNLRKRVV